MIEARHVGIGVFGTQGQALRVVAVVAEGGGRRRWLYECLLSGEAARSAHAAVVDALRQIARRRTDATPLDVYFCQQSVEADHKAGRLPAEIAAAGLTPRWWPKARVSEAPALARALERAAWGGV